MFSEMISCKHKPIRVFESCGTVCVGYPAMGHYLNRTGRPILYSCEWPLYMRALGATVFTTKQ